MDAALHNSWLDGGDDDDTLGFDWGQIIGPATQAGTQFGLSALSNWLGGGQPSGTQCMRSQVSGDQAMTNCVPMVMQQFDQLQSQIGLLPPEQVIAAANQIAAIFSDPRYFDQQIGGRSKQIREAAQAAARQRADAIIAAVASQVQTPQNNQPGVNQPVTVGGITLDTQTILLGGGALFVLLFLLKN